MRIASPVCLTWHRWACHHPYGAGLSPGKMLKWMEREMAEEIQMCNIWLTD